MRRFRTAGLSLLECLVAGTVVILVMLSLLGSVSFALEGVRQLDGQDKATWYAQRLLEGIRERRLASGMGFNDPTGNHENDTPYYFQYFHLPGCRLHTSDCDDSAGSLYR